MSEVFDISSFGELEIGGGSFYLVPAGKYRAQVDQVEWTESKRSGRPMLVTTGIITEVISSSERDAEEAVGKSVTFYTVMTYTDKKTGKEKLHWDIPKLFGAADPKLNPRDPLARAKAWKAKGAALQEYVAERLPGKNFTFTAEVTTRPVFTPDGEPVYETDEDGMPIVDANGEPKSVTRASNNLSIVDFEAAKTGKKASSITL